MNADYIKKSEFWSCMMLLGLHCVLFPLLVGVLSYALPLDMNESEWNLAYYAASFALTLIMLGSFLRRSFDTLIDNIFLCIKYFCLAWGLYYLLTVVFAALLSNIEFLSSSNPNDSNVTELIVEQGGAMKAAAIFLAPIVEETIFRGGLFCFIRPKNRIAAYVVSITLFALYHCWQYTLIYMDLRYLLFMLQYIPAGLALCWCYDRSGSIWTSIFFHMSINLLGVLALA